MDYFKLFSIITIIIFLSLSLTLILKIKGLEKKYRDFYTATDCPETFHGVELTTTLSTFDTNDETKYLVYDVTTTEPQDLIEIIETDQPRNSTVEPSNSTEIGETDQPQNSTVESSNSTEFISLENLPGSNETNTTDKPQNLSATDSGLPKKDGRLRNLVMTFFINNKTKLSVEDITTVEPRDVTTVGAMDQPQNSTVDWQNSTEIIPKDNLLRLTETNTTDKPQNLSATDSGHRKKDGRLRNLVMTFFINNKTKVEPQDVTAEMNQPSTEIIPTKDRPNSTKISAKDESQIFSKIDRINKADTSNSVEDITTVGPRDVNEIGAVERPKDITNISSTVEPKSAVQIIAMDNRYNAPEIDSTDKPQTDPTTSYYPENDYEINPSAGGCHRKPCYNNGTCEVQYGEFLCDCTGTGYMGAVCLTPQYGPSCLAVRTAASIVHTKIDLDGSGPLKPFPVTCEFYKDGKITTTIRHNHPKPVKVDGFEKPGSFNHESEYGTGWPELEELTRRSMSCWQRLSFYCRNAKLFNGTIEPFRPVTWWVSRNNEAMDYWAGAQPGSRKCACGMSGTCIDKKSACNCDADQTAWTEDSGYIREKDFLPVRAVRFGGTGTYYDHKEASYKLGPMRCIGDPLFTYSITFSNATMELPPYNMGQTGDVYFQFKTAARQAVFFYAIGPTDLIKMSLINGTRLEFQFQGGNGIISLFVERSKPFTNTRWHSVHVERNRKQVVLTVDNTERTRVRNFAPNYQYQLSSPFVIGGTVSEGNGFTGSIRGFMLNGKLVELSTYAIGRHGVN